MDTEDYWSHTMRIRQAVPFFSPDSEEDRFLPEGPRKLFASETLAWVNIQTAPEAQTGALHFFDWTTQQHSHKDLIGRPGFFIPTTDPNVLLCGVTHSIGFYNLQQGTFTPVAEIPHPQDRVIINDGEVTPDGQAVIFGTKDTQFREPLGHLYLFTLPNRIDILAEGMTCSNGKILKGAQGTYTLYDIDTPRKNLIEYTLDLAEKRLKEKGVRIDFSSHVGFPDGMVDAGDNTAIVAFYNPQPDDGLVSRYDLATGSIVEQWRVPRSPRVTCPCLVAHGSRVALYLTTATEGMPSEQRQQCPNAGSLFVAETDFAPDQVPQALFRL
jgi:sugar lactone lactonase YvrE